MNEGGYRYEKDGDAIGCGALVPILWVKFGLGESDTKYVAVEYDSQDIVNEVNNRDPKFGF